MFKFSVKDVEKIIGREFRGIDRDSPVKGISIDSRNVEKGDLFVALKGEKYDGSVFAGEALNRGAVAALISHNSSSYSNKKYGIAVVRNTCAALQDIAKANREKFSGKLIGITGSNGKTTVKEMLAAILSGKGRVIKSEGNENNHIGVPLTLLKIGDGTGFAVVEMGMNHKGEIGFLSKLAAPDIAVILNVLRAHMGNFRDLDDVAKSKLEIMEGLKKDGMMIFNADDGLLSEIHRNVHFRSFSFGLSSESDMTALDMRVDDFARPTFILKTGREEQEIRLNLSGKHNVINALAASAAAYNSGAGLDIIKKGLEKIKAVKGRLDIYRSAEGVTVIDDTYNANPDSVMAALDTFKAVNVNGRKIFVMTEMLELGERSRMFHREMGVYAVKSGVDLILTVGDVAAESGLAAIKEGLKKERVHIFSCNKSAGEFLACIVKSDDGVLLKGSRKSKAEEIAGYLNLASAANKESY
ncbi:MAG: UDP-N-acetylmuramoyl-tripeptide--D-alanyl-D-alanine ligase [bacterium]|nr:UDP-N-acetylmuramoyl-tripeptide--D-alanyl-D-alanine ligase [bacterium]